MTDQMPVGIEEDDGEWEQDYWDTYDEEWLDDEPLEYVEDDPEYDYDNFVDHLFAVNQFNYPMMF